MDKLQEASGWRPHGPQLAMDFVEASQRATALAAQEATGSQYVCWTTEEIVGLHFVLLDDLRRLGEEDTPIEERFELLEWVFTDAAFDSRPFSFRACVRLVWRTCDPALAREAIRALALRALTASLAKYPAWLAEQVLRDPQWVADALHRNPQWINETIARAQFEPDLFGEVTA